MESKDRCLTTWPLPNLALRAGARDPPETKPTVSLTCPPDGKRMTSVCHRRVGVCRRPAATERREECLRAATCNFARTYYGDFYGTRFLISAGRGLVPEKTGISLSPSVSMRSWTGSRL